MVRTMEPILKEWYDYLRNGKIMGLKCNHCGAVEFPPVPVCNTCGHYDTEWAEMSGEATLETFSYSPMGIGPYTKEPVMGGFFRTKEGNLFMSWLVGVTAADQEKIFQDMPFPCKAEIIEIDKELGLYFPVFRRVGDGAAPVQEAEAPKAAEEKAQEAAPAPESCAIESGFRKTLADIFEVDVSRIVPEATMQELNASSMKRFMLMAEYTDRTGKEMTYAQIMECNTIADVVAKFSA